MRYFTYVLMTVCLLPVAFSCGRRAVPPTIIPAPQHIEMKRGGFTFPENLTVSISDNGLVEAVNYLMVQLPDGVGGLSVTNAPEGDIILRLDGSAAEGSYRLTVGRKGIFINGGGYSGIVNGISTLRHLIPIEARKSLAETSEEESVGDIPECTIPALEIEDWPRFEWRGLHLDVARHFFDVDEIKNLLDVMSLYKFNKFHWHLTDDEGWRVEIKKYPALTASGGWRELNGHDRGCLSIAEGDSNPDMLLPEKRLRHEGGKTLYGGFYTREEIKEVVTYAARRGIDVIPELDMPGHSTRAIENFPSLSCFGKPEWGHTFSAPLCPGRDATLEFCRDVYAEIFELFPYKYVHLGADEVEKDNWEKCPACQKRIEEEHLAGEVELQAWFVGEMEKFFNENGRTLIGWDEIADGTLSESAAVMWWRSWAPANVRKALGQGNRVVMCPNSEFYLDYGEGKNSVSNIYNFDPFEERLQVTEEQKQYIMGLQGNLWTEWVPTWERLGYQYFPRAFAVSEAAWTMPENKDEEDFNRRVIENYARLEQSGMNYRLPAVEGYWDVNAFVDTAQVEIHYPLDNVSIRYTTDGSVPTGDSPLLAGPLILSQTTDLALRTFRHDGRAGDIVRWRFVKSDYAPAVEPAHELQTGLAVKWYDYTGSNCAAIIFAPLAGEYVTDGVRIPEGVSGNTGLTFDGYIEIPKDGIYTFWLESDDGSMLYIDGQTVIDNDGAHSPREVVGQAALGKGLHALHARYWDYNGGLLRMGIISAGQRQPLDDQGWFRH